MQYSANRELRHLEPEFLLSFIAHTLECGLGLEFIMQWLDTLDQVAAGCAGHATATGTGCKDIIAAHGATALPAGACWTTRGHRVLRLESSAILQLWGRST